METYIFKDGKIVNTSAEYSDVTAHYQSSAEYEEEYHWFFGLDMTFTEAEELAEWYIKQLDDAKTVRHVMIKNAEYHINEVDVELDADLQWFLKKHLLWDKFVNSPEHRTHICWRGHIVMINDLDSTLEHVRQSEFKQGDWYWNSHHVWNGEKLRCFRNEVFCSYDQDELVEAMEIVSKTEVNTDRLEELGFEIYE